MRIKTILLLLTVIITSINNLHSQGNLEEHVQKLLEANKYIDAYDILADMNSDDKEYYYRKGITQFYLNMLDEAMSSFRMAYDKGYEDENLLYYIAQIHHKKGEFKKAASAYKLYLNELDDDDPMRYEAILAIKKCGYANKAIYMEQQGFVENMGKVVNTVYDEYAPMQSPNFTDKYYFSSNRSGSIGGLRNVEGLKDEKYGNYRSDIYAVELANGAWIPSTGVPSLLNTARNEDIQCFSKNGEVLVFISSGGSEKAQVKADTFSSDNFDFPNSLAVPVAPDLGDQDLYFANDSTLFFSSKREGGFGGYDIYFSQRNNNRWSTPKNLGSKINGPYDERSPFLTNSGNILYFSSNREESSGGFDVFRAVYGIERGEWKESENIGNPISSPGDDLYFRLGPDGRSGVLASNRKESLGGLDLFIVYLKTQVKEQLVSTNTLPFLVKNDQNISSLDPIKNKSTENDKKPKSVAKEREIVINPLFYDLNSDLLDGSNSKVMKGILDMMTIYPEIKVSLEAYSTKDGGKAYDMYFTIKRAEAAANYLVKNGISPERIYLKGFGSNYPVVKNLNSPLAKKNNRRIDIKLLNTGNTSLQVSYGALRISDYLKDDSYSDYQKKIRGLTYRVEAAKVIQMYDNPIVMAYDDVCVEKRADDNEYSYKVGLLDTYFAARNLKNQLIQGGFPNVSVYAYLNGHKLSNSEITELSSVYPDLMDYIKYELD